MRSIKAMFVLLFCLMAILAVAMFKVTRQVADLRLEPSIQRAAFSLLSSISRVKTKLRPLD